MKHLIERLEEAKAPKGKKGLLGYFVSLHDQLEKEFNYEAEELAAMSASELKRETKKLEDHLAGTPAGLERVDTAKKDAADGYRWLVKLSGGILK